MKIWQFKIKMKTWADDGSEEFETLEIGTRFPQHVKAVRNKINNCIGDIVLYYNSTTLKSKKLYEGVYLVCKIVSLVKDDYIELEVIKELKETPYMYDNDFSDLHIYQNTKEERGRAQTYELINIDKCNLENFYHKVISYQTGIDSLLEDIKEIENDKEIKKTEKNNLVKCRLGQGSFRKELIEYWKKCCVTGINHIDILVASHIKPWKDSSDIEKLDSFNGLLLLPTIDKLFDKGYISFNDNGEIMISKKLKNYELLGINNKMIIEVSTKHHKYLQFHRENVFRLE